MRVRQAINYALDRPALLKAVGEGYGQVTEQIFGATSTAYDKSLDSTYPYDPAKAKAAVPGGLRARQHHLHRAGEQRVPACRLFPDPAGALERRHQRQLRAGGNATFLPNALAGKYSSMLMQLKAGPTTWETVSNTLLATSGWNALHYSSSTVEKLAHTIQSGSAAKADAAAKQLNTYIVDQAWFAPIYYPEQSFVSDSHTTLETQVGNAYPYLWNITPKS